MKKSVIFAAITTAIGMASAGLSYADDMSTSASTDMEKCQVVKDGKGLIKEHAADCKTASTHSCQGQNAANDPESWINVPTGQCAKINAGDLSGVSDEIKNKIDVSALIPSTQNSEGSQTGVGAQSTNPAANGSEPAANGSEPAANGSEPAADGSESPTNINLDGQSNNNNSSGTDVGAPSTGPSTSPATPPTGNSPSALPTQQP